MSTDTVESLRQRVSELEAQIVSERAVMLREAELQRESCARKMATIQFLRAEIADLKARLGIAS